MTKRQVRCAIYTRKSTEEGLDQEFNTLDAQREACAAYIKSQAHEGWKPLSERYDDGGYSGGTMERPALQQLMDDIRNHRVDVIVAYKIDRLTRSLSDFARLAETFDEHGVSFVSVTQQFNTTTSMGRLTLNMLLSFAQFEREVTGERIRDKIAASKKKGMWMGGTTPLGYKVEDRKLVIVPDDAETVRTIYRLYLECGDVPALMQELDERGIRTKVRTDSTGRTYGGRRFQRGHLYRLLSNPVYIGRIPHRDQSYPGPHEAIIDMETWEAVQKQLGDNTQGPRKRRRTTSPSLLVGILEDNNGNRFTPAHASKKGRRYRYYVEQAPNAGKGPAKSQLRRIPAREVESAVRKGIHDFLGSPQRLLDTFGDGVTAQETDHVLKAAESLRHDLADDHADLWIAEIQPLLKTVTLGRDGIRLAIDRIRLRALLGLPSDDIGDTEDPITIDIPARIRSRGHQMKIVIEGDHTQEQPEPDMALIKAVARAHDWFEQLKTGEAQSVGDIARAEGITHPYVSRILKLAFLAPDVVEAILEGRQPIEMTADRLTLEDNVPVRWDCCPLLDEANGMDEINS